MFNDFKVALAFLTRIPVKHDPKVHMPRSASLFPLIGLLVGIVAGVCYLGFSEILPPFAAAALTVTVSTMLTGAFHLDGWGDIFDGLVGGWNPKQRLEILKDSRHGTYGVAAISLQLILQISLISSFPGTDGFWVLVLTHSVARAVPIYLMQIPATPGHEGMGATISKEVKLRDVFLATAITLVIGISILELSFVFMLLLLFLSNAIFVRWVISKIGGLLGDSFGAAEQLSETTILIYLAATFFITGSLTWNF